MKKLKKLTTIAVFATLFAVGNSLFAQSISNVKLLHNLHFGTRIYEASFSADGTKIVTASADQTIKIWDANTGQCLRNFRCDGFEGVYTASFTPDGSKVVSVTPFGIIILDANTGQCLQVLKGEIEDARQLSDLIISPDGAKIVYSSAFESSIKIWDINTGFYSQIPMEKNLRHPTESSFSPDGKRIASRIRNDWGGNNKEIKIFDASTGQCLQTINSEKYLNSVSFSPDGTKIISGSGDKTVKIWDANTGQCIQTLKGHKKVVCDAKYSPDGRKIVSASYDKTIKIWDANTGQCLQTLQGHTESVWSVSFSSDGKKIVSSSWDQSVKIWSVE